MSWFKKLFGKKQSPIDPTLLAFGRGVSLLDQTNPGWHRKVNTDELSMWSVTKCVLGQVFGLPADNWCENGFNRGMVELDIAHREATEYGFCPTGFGTTRCKETELTALWKQEIEKRKAV